MRFEQSLRLRQQAHRLIPGGAHTYAKGDDQYPQLAPGFIARGLGSHVWDVDGNEFIEYGMGLRAVSLGHAYPPVVEAVTAQLQLGANFTRPAPIEVAAAETVLSALDGSASTSDRMIKFAKNGSDATTAAVRLARAFTGRDLVAICSDQPFFSVDDWFIATTDMPSGVPDAVRALSLRYSFNNVDSVQAVFDAYPGRVAALVLEAETAVAPQAGFLTELAQRCRAHGALLILDEIITGFRCHLRGAQYLYQLQPDLSIFGKAMGNGFSVAALVGRREIMELGGLNTDRERVFLLSTTHGAETHALAAAKATIETYQREPVIEELHRKGERLARGVAQAAQAAGVADHVSVAGRASNLIHITRDQHGHRSQAFRALFLQELIRRGVLAPSFVVSYAHTDTDIARTVDAVSGALELYRQALDEGVDRYLIGPPVRLALRRYV